jgi:lysophospholipase L1-like esterase
MNTYLALGDSYTIGEQVPVFENFPYRVVQLLRNNGTDLCAPEIVAKTGFTTDELLAQIAQTKLNNAYDMVTLLIGVNNQYRGRTTDSFQTEFEQLLHKAIGFAVKKERVLVISIPDWGVTPFAEGKDRKEISNAIDAYNQVCVAEAAKHKVQFLDITKNQRKNGHLDNYLAPDKLHPSGLEYSVWAEAVADYFQKVLST